MKSKQENTAQKNQKLTNKSKNSTRTSTSSRTSKKKTETPSKSGSVTKPKKMNPEQSLLTAIQAYISLCKKLNKVPSGVIMDKSIQASDENAGKKDKEDTIIIPFAKKRKHPFPSTKKVSKSKKPSTARLESLSQPNKWKVYRKVEAVSFDVKKSALRYEITQRTEQLAKPRKVPEVVKPDSEFLPAHLGDLKNDGFYVDRQKGRNDIYRKKKPSTSNSKSTKKNTKDRERGVRQ